jgi:16S rRNA (cytidine1402-2'-O)-methyltransferase
MSMLYVVSTPIGNLKDITLRAIECLKEVDYILAEDTRHTRILCDHYGISTPLVSLHQHNEVQRSEQILGWMQEGKRLALVSDAGTPLISDPGFRLIQTLRAAGCSEITTVPGPCALIAGLSISGLDTRRFRFEGFLPVGTQERERLFTQWLHDSATLVFYEAPHRLESTLRSLHAIYGESRQIVLAKELTKMFEACIQGTPLELLAWLEEDARRLRGEFVVLVEGARVDPDSDAPKEHTLSHDTLFKTLLNHMPHKQAVQCMESLTGLRRNDLYAEALQLKSQGGEE